MVLGVTLGFRYSVYMWLLTVVATDSRRFQNECDVLLNALQCKEGECLAQRQPEVPAEEPGRHGAEAERHAGAAPEGHRQAAHPAGAEQQPDQRPAEGGKRAQESSPRRGAGSGFEGLKFIPTV